MDLQEKWFTLIRECEENNQSQRDFCKAHNLKISTFGYWRKKYIRAQNQTVDDRSKSTSGTFLTLTSSISSFEVIYPNGVRIQIPSGTPANQLSALIRLY